jgi:leucyl/phenylalanyl-tRNA---protein transferase
MPVFQLNDHDLLFPPQELAEPSGLIGFSSDLSKERVLTAYSQGIFPWFEDEGQFFWFCPDPRCVLFPAELKVHKSMNSIFNQHKFQYSYDTCFTKVMEACAERKRTDEEGTWISDKFLETYSTLHELGIAHSVEVWQEGLLVGGLYGLAIGKIFYGESMFALVTNASKAGFITLTRHLQKAGYWLIDCQQETKHLVSMGARGISRDKFLEYVSLNQFEKTTVGKFEFSTFAQN